MAKWWQLFPAYGAWLMSPTPNVRYREYIRIVITVFIFLYERLDCDISK